MHATDPNRLSRRTFVPGLDRRDKLVQMLEAFFDPNDHSVRSFREVYVAITGDKKVTGRIANCDHASLREAFGSGDLSNLLGDSITRRMIRDYGNADRYRIWPKLVTVAKIDNFRTQHRVRYGGYGDLPTVAEGQAYGALASPDDEDVTYAIGKRGGTESINLEHIKNDDVALIQSVPKKLAHAAKRTLSKFVFDFIRTNPAIYDGVALFHATHGNLGSAPLSAAAVAAGRVAMRQHTELGSGDPLPIEPRVVWVPFDLEETAVNLFRRGTNNDKTFLQSRDYDVQPVWYWTDTTDWVLSADPNVTPTIELGFLDGVEEPELFVQDAPTTGSLFSNDQLTWKIRHIYGGAVMDYRGFYKSVAP